MQAAGKAPGLRCIGIRRMGLGIKERKTIPTGVEWHRMNEVPGMEDL